jgi:hypothetical protein
VRCLSRTSVFGRWPVGGRGRQPHAHPWANSVAESVHQASHGNLAWFITAPGETDVLMVVAAVFLVFSALGIGVVYFRLLALPMQFANVKVQGPGSDCMCISLDCVVYADGNFLDYSTAACAD